MLNQTLMYEKVPNSKNTVYARDQTNAEQLA